MVQNERNDPYLNARFLVEINGLLVAGFSEVTGLQMETESQDYIEGGVNDYIHKLPKLSKQSNISLKRGITDSDALWKWHQDVVNGIIERRNGRIILKDFEGNEKWRWEFKDAFPIKWSGPDFRAGDSAVAVESLDLVHHGITRI